MSTETIRYDDAIVRRFAVASMLAAGADNPDVVARGADVFAARCLLFTHTQHLVVEAR